MEQELTPCAWLPLLCRPKRSGIMRRTFRSPLGGLGIHKGERNEFQT